VKPSHELNFAHSNNNYSSELKLCNKRDQPVIFKVRTTAAKSYVVLPTCGMISAGESTIVKIYMLPRESIRNRADDKFLIQAVICTDDELKPESKAINEKFDLLTRLNLSGYFHSTKLKVHFVIDTVIQDAFSEDNIPIRRRTRTLGHIPDTDSSHLTVQRKSTDTLIQSPVINKVAQRARIGYGERSAAATLGYIGGEAVTSFSPRDLIEKECLKSHPRIMIPRTQEHSIVSYDFIPPNKGGIVARTVSSYEKENRELPNDIDHLKPLKASHSTPVKSRGATTNSRECDALLSTGEVSNVESSWSPLKQAAMYKQKLLGLEKRFKHQKLLLAKINEEKTEYLTELHVLKLSTIDQTKEEVQPNIGNNKIEIWQLLVVSIIFLICGSLWK